MARAGYDPRDMASMFETIQARAGNGGPEWVSSHPNPSNRKQAITQESAQLTVSNPIRNTRGFTQVKSRLQRMPAAPSTEQAMRQAKGQGGRQPQGGRYPSDARVGQVQPPSDRFQTFEEGNLFRVSVPSNWRELPASTAVTFAPQGGYGSYQGQDVFTHGVQIGVDPSESHNLRTASSELIQHLRQNNPQIRQNSQFTSINLRNGRSGLATVLTNVSHVTGQQEGIALYTTLSPTAASSMWSRRRAEP